MFGMKLKSWMEAHLGRPKTSKQANANGTTTATSHSNKKVSNKEAGGVGVVSLSQQPTPANSSSTFSDSSSNSADIIHVGNSGVSSSVSSGTSQGTVNVLLQPSACSSSATTEYLHDRDTNGLEGHNHNQEDKRGESSSTNNCSSRPSQTNHNNNNSAHNAGILLGGTSVGVFNTNNLSSPDTGYSTDGYSPKSVYPALSFESSGKSTPKSSYTISSLVSSELLHNSSSSASCSSSSKVLPTTTGHGLFSSSGSGSVSIHVHLDGLEKKMVEVVERRITGSPGKSENEILMEDSSNTTQHNSSIKDTGRGDDNDSVKKKPSLNEPSFHQYSHDKESPQRLQTTNPFHENPSSSSSVSSYSQLNKNSSSASNHLIESSAGEPSCSSSSKAPKLRTLAGASLTSDSKSSLPGYSISSPRKERTKIKTNPWLPIFPHSNISNGSHANSIVLGKSTTTTTTKSSSSSPADDDGDGLLSPVKCRVVSCGEETTMKESGDERLLRVSTTSGGSDSGKGSLGTNRNSTESSVLLTDSPRNSIISHETPQDSADDTNTPSPTAHQQSHSGPHPRWTSQPPSSQKQQQQPSSLSSQTRNHKKKSEDDDQVKRIVTMVDKETDILSDWAGTDEDDDEVHEGNDEETEGPATPTPSTPTDSRVPGGRSSSSDIDFGDSSAATYSGISCPIQQRSASAAIDSSSTTTNTNSFFHHHQPNIIKVFPKNIIPPGGGIDSSNSSFFPIQSIHHSHADKRILNSPPVTAGIHPSSHYSPFTGLVYSDPSIDSDYLNANILGDSSVIKSPPSSSSSQALARGALGFLRKIFRKTSSCSSQRPTSPGSDRVRMRFRKDRSSRGDQNKESIEDFVPMRSPLLTAATDSLLLSPHPLVGRRNPLHPHHTFLTPTPNAFRRRSGGGSSGESGESKTSSSSKSGLKNLKPVKTDIIRLPSGGTSSRLHNNNTTSASSTGTTSSSENNKGVFCVSTLLENPYEGPAVGGDGPAGNSSGSSSLHSMSTSVSAASGNNGNHSGRNNQSSHNHHLLHHQHNNAPLPSAAGGFPFQDNLLHNQRDSLHNNKGQFNHHLPGNFRDFDSHHQLNHNRPHQQQAVPPPAPPVPPVGINYSSAPFNNSYSPIHRLVVTSGGASSHFIGSHPSESPIPPPRSSGIPFHPSSQPPPPPPQMVMSTFTPTPHHNNRASHNPQTYSPSANTNNSSHHHLNHRPPSSCAETFIVSPSPILGNPRYQFIPSSNQNSPMLNVHKRQPPVPISYPQQASSNSFSSPIPPPRTNNSNNHHPLNPFVNTNGGTPSPHFNTRRGSVSGSEVMIPHNNLNASSNLLPSNRVNVLSRSHSYQQQQLQQQNQQQQHYYASPSHHQRPPLPPQQHQPLLMRTHLHNQNIRLNNFLMNKQRSSSSVKIGGGGINSRPKNSQSFHERIYESVDSEDEEDCIGDDEEGNEVEDEDEEYDEDEADCRRRLGNGDHQVMNTRPPPPPRMKRPPVPMALFGPNTFLSETETRLLEADREADRKYKRLINEAEALLREISAVKSQQIQQQSKRNHHHQPWVNRSHHEDRFQMEECPQSDPLRRKAYDCWALRRLQQELAGCCASPPVLHRSRMNLQSPSTPTGNNGGLQPYPVGLSLISHHNNDSMGASSMLANNNMDNRASGHF